MDVFLECLRLGVQLAASGNFAGTAGQNAHFATLAASYFEFHLICTERGEDTPSFDEWLEARIERQEHQPDEATVPDGMGGFIPRPKASSALRDGS